MAKQHSIVTQQLIPISLTTITFLLLTIVLYGFIKLLNLFPGQNILLTLRPQDILIGMTIYSKTAIDFALVIGNLMANNKGWKDRIAIEVGTQVGNGMGTLFILTIWYFFKQIPLLLALMIFLAAIVLLAMAEEGFESLLEKPTNHQTFHGLASGLVRILRVINQLFRPLTKLVLPEKDASTGKKASIASLAGFSFVIPFILGLDDFAGYIPLFSLVNVFSFSIGVFLAHALLLTFLFLSPKRTTIVIRHKAVIIFGGIAFIGIALYGFYEVAKIILSFF